MRDDPSRSRRAFLGRVGQAAAALVGGGLVAGVARADDSRGSLPGGSSPGPAGPAGAGGPGLAPPIAPTAAACPVHDDLPRAADPAVLGFLGPVGVGTPVGAWTVARVHAVFRGALPFVLAHPDGRKAQVDLMPADAASPPGIATTTAGHLYLVNAGRGATATPPDLAQAIHALGHRLAGRAGAGLGLRSYADRHRCHPGGVFVVPV